MTTWLTETVVVHRRVPVLDAAGKPTRDSYGNPVTQLADHPLPDCTWEPRTSSENTDMRETVTAGLTLYCADPDADLLPADTLTVEGEDWQVEGRVSRFRGTLGHAAVTLSKVTG